jgi:hypothetical protein
MRQVSPAATGAAGPTGGAAQIEGIGDASRAKSVRMVGHDAFGGSVVEPPKNVPNFVETGIDQTFSGRVAGLASLICSLDILSLKKAQLSAHVPYLND